FSCTGSDAFRTSLLASAADRLLPVAGFLQWASLTPGRSAVSSCTSARRDGNRRRSGGVDPSGAIFCNPPAPQRFSPVTGLAPSSFVAPDQGEERARSGRD